LLWVLSLARERCRWSSCGAPPAPLCLGSPPRRSPVERRPALRRWLTPRPGCGAPSAPGAGIISRGRARYRT
jgi:hypothetical protein